MQFLLSSDPDKLEAALAGKKTVTVEAEYGQRVVLGSVFTMAHHTGEWIGKPAPCSFANLGLKDLPGTIYLDGKSHQLDAVGLSHFDLDTLGGCAALLGRKPFAPGFWELAAFVDLNGAHKLGKVYEAKLATVPSKDDLELLYAFWAWSRTDEGRVQSPRDGEVIDVTERVLAGVYVLERLLATDNESDRWTFIERGAELQKDEAKLNESSFVELTGGVIARVSDQFVNHFYTAPDGQIAEAVVAFGTKQGSVTISFADEPKSGVNARDLVQQVFPDKDATGNLLAGGHAGIAGSPRGRRATLSEFVSAVLATTRRIQGGSG